MHYGKYQINIGTPINEEQDEMQTEDGVAPVCDIASESFLEGPSVSTDPILFKP